MSTQTRHTSDVSPPIEERTVDFHKGRLYQLIWCLDNFCTAELSAQARAKILTEIIRIEDEHGI
jgi:hypothetical protein